jgi:hypothetical protein
MLAADVAAWQKRRNAERAGMNWMFTVERAREKLGRAYPLPARPPLKAAVGMAQSSRDCASSRAEA